jgi:ATP-dependent RNA helicase DDX55/SPB4
LLVGGSNRSVLKDLECFHEYGSDIIVATPGRLEDVLSRYDNIHLNSQNFECLILDEADILLDMGFENTLSSILARVPKMRRTGLFSATQTKAVKMLGRAGLRNPVMVNVSVDATANNEKNHVINNSKISVAVPSTQQATPSSLTNYYMVCPLDEKLSRLVEFIRQHRDEKIVVFCISCAIVEFFGVVLPQIDPLKGIAVESLHGKMVQKRREKVLERFRSSEKKGGILICTDVAARGLDVSDVNWVLQFDAPPDPNAFVHRVGRCARAGRSGRSLIFLSGKEDAYVEFLRLRKIPTEPLPASERCTLPSSEVKSAVPTSKEKGVLKNDDEQSEQVLEAKQLLSHDGERILDILPCIKLIVLHDREALEKGTKAFTSYIRAYKEHQCSFIFR